VFKIFINNGIEEIPDDDIFYIVAKEGIFLKKKVGILESITPVDNISILNSISSSAKLDIPKISNEEFYKIITFFKKVYDLYKGESIIVIYYNLLDNSYFFDSPLQEVSPGGIKYTRNASPKNYIMIATIHSHGFMSAFHSGIDINDEKYFDGLHITIGNIPTENVSISACIVSNGSRFIVDPTLYIDGLVLSEDSKEVDNFKKLRYLINENKCNYNVNDWLKNVSERVYVSNFSMSPYSFYNNQQSFPFSSSFLSSGNINYSLFNNNIEDEEYNPCNECVFRNYKMKLQIEEWDEDNEDYLDVDVEDFFYVDEDNYNFSDNSQEDIIKTNREYSNKLKF